VSRRMARCRGGRPLCGVLFRVLALCAALCSPTPAPASVGGGGRGGRPATVPSASLVFLRGGTSSTSDHEASGQPPDRDRGGRRSAQREHAGGGSKDAGEPRRYNLRHRLQSSVPPPSPSGSGRPLRPAVSPRTRHSTAAAGRDAKVRGGAECQALRDSTLTSLLDPLLCCAVLCCVRMQGGCCGMDTWRLTSSGRRRIGRAGGGGVKAPSSPVSLSRNVCLLSAPRPQLCVHAPLTCPSFIPEPRLSERERGRESEREKSRVGRGG